MARSTIKPAIQVEHTGNLEDQYDLFTITPQGHGFNIHRESGTDYWAANAQDAMTQVADICGWRRAKRDALYVALRQLVHHRIS